MMAVSTPAPTTATSTNKIESPILFPCHANRSEIFQLLTPKQTMPLPKNDEKTVTERDYYENVILTMAVMALLL